MYESTTLFTMFLQGNLNKYLENTGEDAKNGLLPPPPKETFESRRELRLANSISPRFLPSPHPVHEGPVCVLDGTVYRHGQTFFPSCKYQCVCRDGQIGCLPRCTLDVMLPGPDCPMPRRVQLPGECCEKWVCEPQVEASALGGFAMAGE